MTTLFSTALVFSPLLAIAADNITTDTVNTATVPISKEAMLDPRLAASGFVEHVNYARVALAMKNIELGKQHITQARNLVTMIKTATAEQRRITDVESGRIIYKYDTEHKYHYFPIQTGPIQVKQMSNGPLWAKNDLAVTDADIVYLTLDLTGDKPDAYLVNAETAINAGNLKEADNQLALLIEEVATVESRATVPHDKALDNIALARNFIAGKNYDGASYALKHADEALDEMQRNDEYKTRSKEIATMRKDVGELQKHISQKDPNMVEKADKKMESWWKELNSWSKNKK